MQAEVKDAYRKLFETEDLTTQPGPPLVDLVDHRITEMAGGEAAGQFPALCRRIGDATSPAPPARPRAIRAATRFAWPTVKDRPAHGGVHRAR